MPNRHGNSQALAQRVKNVRLLCDRFNLSYEEYSILVLVKYEERPVELIVKFTKAFWRALGFPLSRDDDYEAALQSLTERGYVQVIDSQALAEIEERLRASPAIGPTSGLPRPGTVHFTLAGLKLYGEFLNAKNAMTGGEQKLFSITASPVYYDDYCDVYAPCFCGACCFIRNAGPCEVVSSERVGRWRCYWWDEYESGFRVTLKLFSKSDRPGR